MKRFQCVFKWTLKILYKITYALNEVCILEIQVIEPVTFICFGVGTEELLEVKAHCSSDTISAAEMNGSHVHKQQRSQQAK